MGRQFTIDLKESFPHLPHAPIVEAVIHWRARSEKALEPDKLLEELKERLPNYPTAKPQHEVQLQAQIGPAGSAQAQHARWHGFRLESTDHRYIAQFTRNGFVFSRVSQYENWDRFLREAMRLWQIHVELTEPSEIERLGVRFINRVVPVELDKLNDILTTPPQAPGSLAIPIAEFLHRNLYIVHPYSVNVIQTSQPPAPPETDAIGLILDIDVFTTATIEPNSPELDDRLAEMRWLKNKTFYSLLTPQTIERFKESKP